MRLPFFGKPILKAEDYFGLLFNSESAVGFIFQLKDKQVSLIAQEKTAYSSGWEKILEDTDKLITSLENQAATHLDKVIFFLHSYLVDSVSQEIKSPYKDIIKNLSKSLELKPLGFIELHEAVVDYIRKRDQSPLNITFIELDKNHLSVFIYKGDRQIVAKHTPRTEVLSDDVMDIFRQINPQEHLPSKIVVYGQEKDDEINELKTSQWDNKLFIQPPRIESLSVTELYEQLKSVFATQMTAQVAADKVPAFTQGEEEEPNSVLGFTVGQDVAQSATPKEEQPSVAPPVQTVAPPQPVSEQSPTINFGDSLPPPPVSNGIFNKFKFPTMSIAGKSKWLIIAIIFIVILIGGGVGFEYFVHKVTVTVMLPAQTVAKTLDLELPLNRESGDLTISAKTTTLDVNSEKSTTGEREVGEKATGQVVIYNFDNQVKSLPAGTNVSLDKLSYTLDDDVSVASSSGVSADGTKQAGKSKVGATAAAIGPEYNIDKDKQLTVDDLPTSLYLAVADSVFTGGSKKNVTTVSKSDLEDLDTAVIAKAKKEGLVSIKKQLPPGYNILTDLTDFTVADSTYNKEVGEEADQVTLKGKVQVDYYTYQDKPFKNMLISHLKPVTPPGFTLQPDKLTYQITASEKTDQSITLKVKVNDKAIKQIPQTELTGKMAGKTTGQMSSILSESYQATGYKIDKTFPPFAPFDAWLPIFSKNIQVNISSP